MLFWCLCPVEHGPYGRNSRPEMGVCECWAGLLHILILRLSVSMDHNGVAVRVCWVRGWAVDPQLLIAKLPTTSVVGERLGGTAPVDACSVDRYLDSDAGWPRVGGEDARGPELQFAVQHYGGLGALPRRRSVDSAACRRRGGREHPGRHVWQRQRGRAPAHGISPPPPEDPWCAAGHAQWGGAPGSR